LNPNVARREGIAAVPEDRIIRANFGRDIALDLSTEESEFAALHFPIDRIFEAQLWVQAALTWVLKDMEARKDHMALINEFSIKVINNFADYRCRLSRWGRIPVAPPCALSSRR
jgi:hypothetical protein